MITTLRLLEEARKLITTPEHWIRGEYARDLNHTVVHPHNPAAVCFCSLGAIDRVYFSLSDERDRNTGYYLDAQARSALATEMGGSITRFNDAHPHDIVIAAWDRAIAKLSQEAGK